MWDLGRWGLGMWDLVRWGLERWDLEMIERYGIIFIFILVIFFSQYIGMFMKAGINFFLELFSALFGVRVL